MALPLKWLYIIVFSFLAIGIVFIANEFYWVALVPIVLGVVVLAMFAIDILLLLIVFFTPLAINLEGKGMKLALSLPTEPLMAGVMLLFLIKIAFSGGFDRKIMRHPVTIMIIIYLVWMFLTCLTSTMVVVSLKHLTAKLWFICPFYFIGTQMFRNFKNIRNFIWLYIIPLLMVILYTIINHKLHGFTEQSAHTMMWPFYNDHTAYAAAIAMFLPLVIAFIFDKNNTKAVRTISFFIALTMLTAMVLSYTRAAWVSLGAALIVYLIFYFKIRFSVVFACVATVMILFFSFQKKIILKIEQNKTQSATDFNKHLQSISNITTDASNLERLNRWHCAIRMFKVKPFWGWGPGTYQFQYAPFQVAKEKTVISTNAGDRGNAHSEYIGPLAESGVLGALTFVLILMAVAYRAIIIYGKTDDKEIKMLVLGVFLGLITYMVHGGLNNFLDTDKAAVPFWGFIAILVAIDVYHSNRGKNGTDNEQNRIYE